MATYGWQQLTGAEGVRRVGVIMGLSLSGDELDNPAAAICCLPARGAASQLNSLAETRKVSVRRGE